MLRGALRTVARHHPGQGAVLASLAAVCLLAGVQAVPATPEGRDSPIEYKVKAAFLFSFTKYVKWPDGAFEKDVSPLVVAVVGKDPFGTALDETLAGKSIGRHPFVIRRFKSANELEPCHLLFVPAAEGPRTAKIAAHYAGTSTLLVGDPAHFAKTGGVVGFFIAKKRVRFEINTDAAARARIEISSQLLKLARIVRDERRRS